MSLMVYVFGASGHGKVVAETLLAQCIPVAGFIDDRSAMHGSRILELPVLGDRQWLLDSAAGKTVSVALGIGDNAARKAIAELLRENGFALQTCVHPRAIVSSSACLGAGVLVMPNAVINAHARIGEGAIVNTAAVVEHDVELGAFSHLSPNVSTGGAARIGSLAHVGLGAAVLPGICVGDRAIVGAGAVVVADVPAGITVVGVPAKPMAAKAEAR